MYLKTFRKWAAGLAGASAVAEMLTGAGSLENKIGVFGIGNSSAAAQKGEASIRQVQLDAIVKGEDYGVPVKALYSDTVMVPEAIRAVSEMVANNYFKGLDLETKEGRKESGRNLLMFFENFKEDSFFKNASQAQMERWITKNWMYDKELAVRLKFHMAEALKSYFSGQFSDYGAVCIPGNNNEYPAFLLVSASAFNNPASVRQVMNGAVSGYRNIEPLLRQ